MCTQFVWVFSGPKGHFPGGVFTSVAIAEEWIRRNHLTGVLTKYPVDTGSFEWATQNGLVNEKLLANADSGFIGSFSSASFDHLHFEDGERG